MKKSLCLFLLTVFGVVGASVAQEFTCSPSSEHTSIQWLSVNASHESGILKLRNQKDLQVTCSGDLSYGLECADSLYKATLYRFVTRSGDELFEGLITETTDGLASSDLGHLDCQFSR